MVLYLIRHGRTAANASGLLQGHLDIVLDEVGLRQAAAVAAAVGRVDRVVSSPLARARQTAEAFGVSVETDDRWIELNYGDFDGKPLSSVSDEMWLAWAADPDFRLSGGETLHELADRVRPALAELIEASQRCDIVVVSHVSPIKAAVVECLEAPAQASWRMFLEPASICRIGIGRRGAPVLRSWNETVRLA